MFRFGEASFAAILLKTSVKPTGSWTVSELSDAVLTTIYGEEDWNAMRATEEEPSEIDTNPSLQYEAANQ
jgi:hypothetical protein